MRFETQQAGISIRSQHLDLSTTSVAYDTSSQQSQQERVDNLLVFFNPIFNQIISFSAFRSNHNSSRSLVAG